MAGPYCAMILGDYGAEVVKIERPGSGDDSRAWPPFFEGKLPYYFAAANRNKRSLALDLKSPEGRAIARALIADADILVENYRVGALERAGLGHAEMAALNPRLVYCSISGFGQQGPRALDPANDIFMQAYSGSMSLTGEPDRTPVKMGLSAADLGAALFATTGILMAIEQRHRTGRGQRVDTSLLEGQLALLSYHLTYFFASGKPPERRGAAGQVNVPYQAFRAADDWIVIAAFTESMWRGVCRALDRTEWAETPRFVSATERVAHREELVGLIGERLATLPATHWIARLQAEGVPCTPVNRIDQVVAEEQVRANGMIGEIEVPGVGPVRMAAPPVHFSDACGAIDRPPPRLGQHSAEILRALGHDEAAIAGLAARNIIGLDTES
jgi:crotonobetainyl-CoA:carnitine CoA-transferase CaiB-like acyl-CoA transferase